MEVGNADQRTPVGNLTYEEAKIHHGLGAAEIATDYRHRFDEYKQSVSCWISRSLSLICPPYIVGLSSQLSSQLAISGKLPHGKLLQLSLINDVRNAEPSSVYKGLIVLPQSLHAVAAAIKLTSLFLRTAQPSCKCNISASRH